MKCSCLKILDHFADPRGGNHVRDHIEDPEFHKCPGSIIVRQDEATYKKPRSRDPKLKPVSEA